MKRTLLFTALLMAAVIFPVFSQPALAATHTVSNPSELKAALSSAGDGDVIEVTANIDLDGQIDFNRAGVTVKIKGGGGVKTIKAGDGGYGNGMFYITGGTIVIENITLDCDGRGRGVYISNNAGFEMKNGSAIRGGSAGKGGGVYLNNGTFNMSAGTISNNTCSGDLRDPYNGGGVCVSNGTFNMSGGTISYNTTPFNSNGSRGGGVFLFDGGTFNMSGGTIENNTAAEGGGVYGGINMNGAGYIQNNTATGGRGGGVYILSTNTLKMTGGYIINNIGGGVYMMGTFIMGTSDERVSIIGNTVGSDEYKEKDNLRLGQGKVINVEGKPADGSLIWVRFTSDPITSTVLDITNNSSAVSENSEFFETVFAPDKPDISDIEISGGIVRLRTTLAQVPVLSALKDKVYNQYADTEELNVNARVTDGGTLSYQWYRNRLYRDTYGSESIYGATTDGYQPDRDRIEIMYYYVVVTNTLKPGNTQSAISNIVKITIKNPDDPDPVDPGFDTTDGTISLDDGTAPNINLAAETINLGNFSVAAYSINGGSKWVSGDLPTDEKFRKLFDKALTLYVTSDFNTKTKKPAEGAAVIKFPKINARPKANSEKLAAAYGETNWYLAKKSAPADAIYSGYEYAQTTDKKTPSGSWSAMPAAGLAIAGGKDKVTYLFRSVPSVSDGYTPGSKAFKITPANYGKEPKYKLDYKKEIIKLKKGDSYKIGGGEYITVSEAKGKELDVSDILTDSSTITVRKTFAGKKPPTQEQILTPLARSSIVSIELSCANGKITDNMKVYEIYDSAKKKWGNVPKVTSTQTFDIRLKASVKGADGNAASAVGKLTLTYGVYDEDKKKSGIIKAQISKEQDVL